MTFFLKKDRARVSDQKKSPLIFILNILHFQLLWQQVKLLSQSMTLSERSSWRKNTLQKAEPHKKENNRKGEPFLNEALNT